MADDPDGLIGAMIDMRTEKGSIPSFVELEAWAAEETAARQRGDWATVLQLRAKLEEMVRGVCAEERVQACVNSIYDAMAKLHERPAPAK